MKKEILRVENVSINYGETAVLRNVSFTVSKGDFLGIIGSNGAGKSTLIKLILGLLQYDEGSITVNNEEVKKIKPQIGYISQKSNSFNTSFPATVGEVVLSGLKKKVLSRYTKSDRQKVKQVLERVGMSGYENKLIGNLSGGQQQRVFIARALMGDNEIIILDEPTVGIDAMSVRDIMELILKINSQGVTVIMTNHDTPSLVEAANKLLIFCEHGNGEIIERKNLTLDEINELYAGRRRHHHA